MMLRLPLLALLFAILSAPAVASFTSYPSNVSPQGPWLIFIQDQWPSSCGGSFSTEVSSDTVNIYGTPPPGVDFCGAAVVPFQHLINPRDGLPADFEFDASVTVNLYLYGELRSSEVVVFNDAGNTPVRVQTGSWVTGLRNHGLFMDRQNDVLTLALFDYDQNGEDTWSYAVGKIDGNVYTAELVSYAEIVCVTQPCDRTAPVRRGQVSMLLLENRLLATYVDVLQSTTVVGDTFVYYRLDFQRPPELNVPDRAPLPDLVGEWIGGMQGDQGRPDDFRAVRISYAGGNGIGAITEFRFSVFDQASGEFQYEIFCTDLDPMRSPRCRLASYGFGDYVCGSEFSYQSVGVDRLQAPASCVGQDGSRDSVFHLYRSDN